MHFSDEVFDRNNNTIFVNIPHPGHNISVPFCINVNLKKVHEIQRFKESYRSFFIDNVFKSDGTLYIATPFDPIFFGLYLKNC